ncbi:hypothetical protein RJT34_09655 [Clitoria ternatea]|uniref:Pentatricopeptide repeat-containing protein n=1 Tax=Clitoria ternatea TaxID=43366 RepID=A0AAN9PVI2_CLITE
MQIIKLPRTIKNFNLCTLRKNPSCGACLIKNHIQQRSFRLALLEYKQTRYQGLYDPVVVPLVLKACASLSHLHFVKALHAESIKAGSDRNVFIGNTLLKAYVKCGHFWDACSLFDTMSERNIVSWNLMIRGFASNGDTVTAAWLFDKVPHGLKNVVTWTVMVDGYAKKGDMEAAREIFEMMPQRNCFVWSSMVHGYFKEGNVYEAEAIFDQSPVRNLEVWNSMIAGYVQNGFGEKALQAFEGVRDEGFEPDGFTLVGVLSACAQLGCLDVGKKIHQMIEVKGITVNMFVLSALVDMYAKCGDLVYARMVFERYNERGIFSWNAMISGLAINGKCQEVLEFFGRMEDSNVWPDAITFIAVLSACAHGGLVSEALEVIPKMEAYGVKIGIRHYGCMVDLLGRAGRLKDAYDLIMKMPMQPNDTVLGAMLGACRIHSDMKMAEQVMKLIGRNSDSDVHSHKVLLSNIYAASEKWEKAERMRRIRVDGGLQKIPGCSSLIFSDSSGLKLTPTSK